MVWLSLARGLGREDEVVRCVVPATPCPTACVAVAFLTVQTSLINSSQILRMPQHVSSGEMNFNLFKFNGKAYGGERKANLK